jgi:hypothetical protein
LIHDSFIHSFIHSSIIHLGLRMLHIHARRHAIYMAHSQSVNCNRSADVPNKPGD